MAGTTIRSSSQLYIDADLQLNSHKAQLMAAGVADTDGVNMGQLNAAVANIGGAIHAPVADLTAAKAVAGTTAPNGHTDRMIMLIESLGLYRYDAQGTDTGNDNTVIVPTDQTTTGRWYKISSVLTDHNNLSGLNVGDYLHLTALQYAALHPQETATTIGAILNGASAETTPIDADLIPTTTGGGALLKITWTTVKAFLKTYFDTVYNLYVHPNHSGDVTSIADGATTIAAGVVTNAKLANVATATFKGRTTAGTGSPEDLSKAQALAILNVADGANAYVHPNHSGDVTSVADGVQTIAANAVTNAKAAQMAANTIKGNNTGATANALDLTVAQIKTMLGLTTSNLSQRTYRATPTGTVNGSNTTFTIAALVLSGTEEVFKNGILMNAGAGNDYTITYAATTTITFLTAPSTVGTYTDVILVNYSV